MNAQELMKQRMASFERLNRWEESHRNYPTPSQALDWVDEMRSMVCAGPDMNPFDVSGILEMHRKLSVLSPRKS